MDWVKRGLEAKRLRDEAELKKQQMEHQKREHVSALVPALWDSLMRAIKDSVEYFRKEMPGPENVINLSTPGPMSRQLLIQKTWHPSVAAYVDLLPDALQVRYRHISDGKAGDWQIWTIAATQREAYFIDGSQTSMNVEAAVQRILKPVLFPDA